ncbi:MAG: YihY/virulence factor BrkB family protein [Acidimicrobiales bacterium]|nr:YihY/virulence factor BrkB family protein [Acidimicrobiales bacterium]
MIYKFVDDQGSYLASLITYFGFLSLFPLLLIATTVLGFILRGHPELAQQLIGSALAQFPIIGDQLTNTAHPLHGSATGLAVGILVALYGGLGFSVALQNAFNQVWAVPMDRRPDPLAARLRGLAMLGVLAVGVLLTTGLAALSNTAGTDLPQLGVALPIGAIVVSVVVNTGVFVLAFRVLTARHLDTGHVLPGAATAGVAWQGLQSLGAVFVSHELRGTTAAYGLFGLVLGLLAWIYLQALVVVLAAEINVVRLEKLWPRALLTLTPLIQPEALTSADRRSYRSYAKTQRYKNFEQINVEIPASRPDEKDTP